MSDKLTLNQAVAIEKGVKTRVYNEITELHKSTQKAELVTGFVKTYQPIAEGGTQYAEEKKLVQVNVAEALKRVAKLSGELYDISATRDFGNCLARADVLVEGKVLIPQAPVPFLLFLEKQLSDLKAFVGKLVELDPGLSWEMDKNTGQWKSNAIKTHRTEKVQEAKVIVPATTEHPAQVKDYTTDKLVGWWTGIGFSGAIETTRKRKILDRIETLVDAVKSARERANMIDVQRQSVGAPIFSYLFD